MKVVYRIFFSFIIFFAMGVHGQDTLYYKAALNISDNNTLPLSLKVCYEKDTVLYFLKSPMQSDVEMIPSKVKYIEDSLSLGFKNVAIVMHLKESQDKSSFDGIFTQRLLRKNIHFERVKEEYRLLRPQTPLPPFDYNEKELSFKNEECEYLFHGTLTYPKKEGKYPLVVLVSGSGAQNRDSEIYGHKTFLVIADYLTKNGIAVFRYDDRGWGEKSELAYKGTTLDFAKDAYSAVKMLKTLDMIDTNKIGICGHSEGGLIAQMLMAEKQDLAFAILMAAPTISGKDILKTQNKEYYILKGWDKTKSEELEKNLKALDNMQFDTTKVNDYWLKYFYETEPKTYLKKIKRPILVLQGKADFQVVARENIPYMKKYLKAKKSEIKVYPNLNHLFQHVNKDNPTDYSIINETISQQVLEDIVSFIKKL
ncbi:MAG: alpha/beta hydrolase [Bacteroidales bacterium]|nr:alpha/beta hydrolase [Bacteroidales bacterium]